MPIGSMVWYIYTHLHEWLMFMVNVGKYTIHGCSGLWFTTLTLCKNSSFRGLVMIVAWRVCVDGGESHD